MSKKAKKKIKNNKKNRKNKKINALKVFLAIFLVLALCILSFIVYSTYTNGWGVKGIIQTALGQNEEKLKDLDPFTVLILGVSKDISSELTDTIMIASYNPKTQKATLISIPRDTFVGANKNKATSYDKINALYQKSPQKTLEAVNKLTGLNILYYVVVSNNALIELVDAIGGVEYNVPIDMNYDDSSQDLYIHLKAGQQKLTGEQAEWLVRFRKNNNGTSYPSSYGDNDLGRMRTQREFLKEVVKQTIQLKNVMKLKSFIDIFKENVTTNITNWSLIKDYVPYLISFDTENIQAVSLPGEAGYYGPYNLSFFMSNKKQTDELIKSLFEEQNGVEETDQSSEENKTSDTDAGANKDATNSVKIELLNGSGDGTLLTKATKALKDKGYNVYKTGTTTSTAKTTIVNKTSVASSVTEDIKNVLGAGNISSSISSSSTVDVTVIIGKDYK